MENFEEDYMKGMKDRIEEDFNKLVDESSNYTHKLMESEGIINITKKQFMGVCGYRNCENPLPENIRVNQRFCCDKCRSNEQHYRNYDKKRLKNSIEHQTKIVNLIKTIKGQGKV